MVKAKTKILVANKVFDKGQVVVGLSHLSTAKFEELGLIEVTEETKNKKTTKKDKPEEGEDVGV